MLNPLIDEIFELILTQERWMVHTLALKLQQQGSISTLDVQPERDLFKRNFLIMNALYQLQQQLQPAQHLAIASLQITLTDTAPHNSVQQLDPLRDYYLDWQNYETTSDEIEELLNDFWQRFASHKKPQQALDRKAYDMLLHRWQLAKQCSLKDIQKRWRQLAMQYHPDKETGDTEKFKELKNEYEQLKASCSTIEN
ncbi:DnaJ domain-containing protein [Pseudoalteromonas sp. KG3]|uniref:DnaJ domain-containing protein n=1 Tax=Pseudoalteromonas prydzensis TaxID=182141 RepID=A0ABR9FIS4_9GAMM|nr:MULTISPECIES: DNA-J related domain-containing protein [Pseudoalteromonas]MBE0456697.1 DnaJ domain-containing protein [Pseudoalteromonas prydzensis]WKD22590.1 DnaJ domain-containing protein [Pseudoalteromonas sp. KG3]